MKIIQPEYTNDATLLSTNVLEDDYDLWDVATTYALDDTVMYITDDVHWVIRSLVAGNIGNIPTGLSTDTKWVKISATNRWKMFDLQTTSQTYNDSSIDVTLAGISFVDSVAALNIDGATIQIIGNDQDDVEFYNETISLISTEGIYDPYTYFFSPLVYLTDIVMTDLPIYALATYQVIITKTGTAKCGTLLIGKLIDVGDTEYGMRIGITDYSVKSAQNEFGDYTITERAYSKNMTLTTFVENIAVNALVNQFNLYRATPLVWIGSDSFSSSFIYGFYKDYGVVVRYTNHSLINFEIEGLS
jgi:hypothetical protein